MRRQRLERKAGRHGADRAVSYRRAGPTTLRRDGGGARCLPRRISWRDRYSVVGRQLLRLCWVEQRPQGGGSTVLGAVLLRLRGRNGMHVVVGGGLFAGGLLMVMVLASLFERKLGPRWLHAELTAMLLCIPTAAMLGLGVAYILVGLAGDHRPIDLAALAGWLAIGFGILWMLRRRRAALVETATPAGSGAPPFEPPDPGPGGPRRA
jgi:hypothetical protein